MTSFSAETNTHTSPSLGRSDPALTSSRAPAGIRGCIDDPVAETDHPAVADRRSTLAVAAGSPATATRDHSWARVAGNSS
jgi:hypothetical protein